MAVSHFLIITNYFYINALLLFLNFLEYLSIGGYFGRIIVEPGLHGSEVSHYDSVFTYSQSGEDFGVKQDNFRNWTLWLKGEPL